MKIIYLILTQSLFVAKNSSWNLKSIFEVVERFDFSVLALKSQFSEICYLTILVRGTKYGE